MRRSLSLSDPEESVDLLKGLASPLRVSILNLLRMEGGSNITEIADALAVPQSTVSANVQVLEGVGLIRTETHKGRKGNQKVCYSLYDEVQVSFKRGIRPLTSHLVQTTMPLGMFAICDVAAPCGLWSSDGPIGPRDVADTFLAADRAKAGLIWFSRGFVEYHFPAHADLSTGAIDAIDFSMELGLGPVDDAPEWPSDVTLSVNGTDIGTWASVGTLPRPASGGNPSRRNLREARDGTLKSWRVTSEGTFLNGTKVSSISLPELDLANHNSVRLRIAVNHDAEHPGGIRILGPGYGNYDQEIVMRSQTQR